MFLGSDVDPELFFLSGTGTGSGIGSGFEIKWNDKSSHRQRIKFSRLKKIKKRVDNFLGKNAASNIREARFEHQLKKKKLLNMV
jgi:hypothetical protein